MTGVNSAEDSAHPPAGYEALIGDAGAYVDGSRLVLRVSGEPEAALAALHGLVTADLAAARRDAAWPSLVLTPKGKVLADVVIVACGELVLMDVPRAAHSDLDAHFGRYLPPRLARLEPIDFDLVRVRGPGTLDRERFDPALATLDGPTYSDRDGSRWDVVAYANGVAAHPPDALDFYLPAGVELPLDVPRVSDAAWDTWRVERGIPLYGRDISKENLPQETGLVAERVSFVKGCYTGQEVLARIHYRGKVNRLLRGFRLAAAEDLPTGAPSSGPPFAGGDIVEKGKKAVGALTSAVCSPVHGWIGLGTVRREVDPGDTVRLRGPGRPAVSAVVVELPFGT